METGKTGLETMYSERYAACFELYLKYGGRNFLAIEREMRERGFTDFHRRILYTRKERGVEKPGWPARFGWGKHLHGNAGALTCMSAKHEQAPATNCGGDDRPNSPPKNGRRAGEGACVPGEDFRSWLKQVSPELTWNWKYQEHLYKYLQRVTDGECKRLMIFMPPRHGKSELVTVRYAGWRLWNDPKIKVIVASYNQKLADRFSRSIRKLLSEEEDKHAAFSEAGEFTTPSARKKREHPSILRQGGEQERPLPSLSKEGWQTDAFGPADGVVTAPPDTQAMDIDSRIRQSADHPKCSSSTNSASQHSQIDNRKSQISRMFPRTRSINTASHWETALGGGVKAVGVGAGVTGFGGQIIIVDDPVKSRAEAESETYRERLWNWYNNDLYTRLEPDASIILIQTRWHQDDLAGRLLQEMKDGGDQWEVVDLPALSPHGNAGALACMSAKHEQTSADSGVRKGDECTPPKDGDVAGEGACVPGKSNDPLGREPGAALCPERFSEAKLHEIKRQLGSYNFSALYQQQPTPAEGGIFKRAWFKQIVDRAPAGLRWKRGYDLAVSTRTTSSFTASFRVAVDQPTGTIYIADGFRGRIEYPDQKRYVLDRVTNERDTDHGIEKALHGGALVQELRREVSTFGKMIRGISVTADKVTRALAWAPWAEEGRVVLVRGPWIRDFVDEAASFPSAAHDDQIDAVSLAVSMLQIKGGKAHGF